jgi:mannose-P-dolichol utilization defect 1
MVLLILNSCKVIMGSAIGILMNGTLLGQILIYQKPALKKQKKEE